MSQATSTYEQVSKAMRAAPQLLAATLDLNSNMEIAIELENSWPFNVERPSRPVIAAAVELVRAEVAAATGRILNKSQADAVYSAMCALNNVSGRVRADFEKPLITVLEYPSGGVHVLRDVGGPGNSEAYEHQSAFATAYGLQQG